VWPSESEPTDHPPPPEEARPLIQWQTKVKTPKGQKKRNGTHTLCCQLSCDFNSRGGSKLRYEGMGLGSLPAANTQKQQQANVAMVALYVYRCGGSANSTDLAYGAKDWKPLAAEGGPCAKVRLTSHEQYFCRPKACHTSLCGQLSTALQYTAVD